MGRIWAVAINTFREAARDRVLHGVLGMGCLALLFSLVIAELSLHQQARVVRDLGLATISLFSVLVAIFLGSSLLYKEIERKTLYVILPKPIRRWEFLLGKYLGIGLTVYVAILAMGAVQLSLVALQAGQSLARLGALWGALLLGLGLGLWRARDRTIVIVPWSLVAAGASAYACGDIDPAVLSGVLAQLVLTMGEVLVLIAVALLFSSFSTPFLTGAFTLGVWLSGRSADDMQSLRATQVGEFVQRVLHGTAEVLPNLHLFVPGHTLLFGDGAAPWPYVLTTCAYGAAYAAVVLACAAYILSRRDFL